MATKKEKPKELKKPAGEGKPGKKRPVKENTDTAPDELIDDKPDTDEPVDREIRNDAVLRGEDHADEKL